MALPVKTKNLLPALAKKNLSIGKKLFRPGFLNPDHELTNFGFGGQLPSVNVHETKKEFQMELAAPGLDRKDFKIETDNTILSISVGKKEDKEEKDANYRRKEFSFYSFCRTFALPENILTDKIEAHYENGILRLVLPKKEITLAKAKKEIKIA